MDEELHKNLLFIKSYEGEFEQLSIDFTVCEEVMGVRTIHDLVPNGKSVDVSKSNRIQYTYLVANHHLNTRIREHCRAFMEGINDLIDLTWLRMFDPVELQQLISGDETVIDIEDLKAHAVYGGGYDVDHGTVVNFWEVVSEFSPEEKSLLLKFVTGCSRPPLLGFKNLRPHFTIYK